MWLRLIFFAKYFRKYLNKILEGLAPILPYRTLKILQILQVATVSGRGKTKNFLVLTLFGVPLRPLDLG